MIVQLCKARLATGEVSVGVLQGQRIVLLDEMNPPGVRTLSDWLHAPDLNVHDLLRHWKRSVALSDATLLAPLDHQEVWAAGVTYQRSQEARERESVGAARFYDLVYTAPRPELFFKATPSRVVGPDEAVVIRGDSRWSVPEPELALVLSPSLQLVGYTIGNDMSARDIEGENPLYLPQAKVYAGCCALGPCVTLASALPPPDQVAIRLTIERAAKVVFDGDTRLSAMARSFGDLISWLGRDNQFPHGVILLTGTGIVPPDDFTLADGDVVTIEITGIGRLRNRVRQGMAACH
jgi:2-dehydro-3-deoxy-D-arabinonate dehydratase